LGDPRPLRDRFLEYGRKMPMMHQLDLPGLGRSETRLAGLSAPVLTGAAGSTSQMTALLRYPDVPSEVLCARAKELGHAAELQVDSVMARLGVNYAAFAEHAPYDRVIWFQEKCLRLQIKGRNRDTFGDYVFDVRKGYQRGPSGTKPYVRGEFDILALVALPENVVKFTAEWADRHVIRAREIPGLRARPGESLMAAFRAFGVTFDMDAAPGQELG
jgi:hypothetical protein